MKGENGVAFVKIEGLRKRFGALAAVDGVSLSVAEGQTMALLGPSGCGKTTILRCMAGLETPQDGHIEIAGKTVFDDQRRINLMPEERGLGIVFQSYAVWPHMTVAENVGFPLKVRGMRDRGQRVKRILELVGLAERSEKLATDLSGGQQQRVALARALIHEPRLVLFDEPMSNLDAQLREHMRMEVKLLQQRLKFTAIYVTHDQAEAFALAETVVLMNRGRIEAQGPPREIAASPRTPFAARFLGFNVLEGRLRSVQSVSGSAGDIPVADVQLPGGGIVQGRVAGTNTLPAAGQPVLLCIRREHVGLEANAVTPLAGTIRAASFLGLDEEYVVDVGGQEIRAVHSVLGLAAGEQVGVTLAPQHCIVLSGSEKPDPA